MDISESESDSSSTILLTISVGSCGSLIIGRTCVGESAEVESADDEFKLELYGEASLVDESISRFPKNFGRCLCVDCKEVQLELSTSAQREESTMERNRQNEAICMQIWDQNTMDQLAMGV